MAANASRPSAARSRLTVVAINTPTVTRPRHHRWRPAFPPQCKENSRAPLARARARTRFNVPCGLAIRDEAPVIAVTGGHDAHSASCSRCRGREQRTVV